MAEQRVAVLTDVGRMLSRYGEFAHVTCPACGLNDWSSRFEKNGLSYMECKGCQTIYVTPRPTPAVLEWFYKYSPNYEYWNRVIFPASEEVRRSKIFVPRVDRVLELCDKYGVDKTSLLEVGAGFGTFCVELKARNKFTRIVAVEPTPDLARTCRNRGIETLEQPIEQIQLGDAERFGVVATFEVIEHLFAPLDFAKQVAKLMRPGGLLVLTCPNGQGFDIEALGPVSSTVDHEHLNYFNPKSLAAMLSSCGFEVLESFTPGRLDAELVRNELLSGRFDLREQPFLKRVLVDEWERLGQPFQDFLAEHGLSSNLWVVARKSL